MIRMTEHACKHHRCAAHISTLPLFRRICLTARCRLSLRLVSVLTMCSASAWGGTRLQQVHAQRAHEHDKHELQGGMRPERPV